MRQPDDEGLLVDTLVHGRKIGEVLDGVSRPQFDADEIRTLALLHLIQIIGEAASRTTQPLRARHPEIPWARIIGMRHRVVHGYETVDLDVVWDTATKDVPILTEAVETIVRVEFPEWAE
jgi:uncharacterized protein with HEPN domain